MIANIRSLFKRGNGEKIREDLNYREDLVMEKILRKSIELVDLSPVIEKEAEDLKKGTEEIDKEVRIISSEMDAVKTVVDEVSQSANENVKRILKVNENVSLTKKVSMRQKKACFQ